MQMKSRNMKLMGAQERKKYRCHFCGSQYAKYWVKTLDGTFVPSCNICALLPNPLLQDFNLEEAPKDD